MPLVSCLVSIWLRNFINFILVVSNCALISTTEKLLERQLKPIVHMSIPVWVWSVKTDAAGSLLHQVRMRKTSKKSPPVPHISFFPSFYTLFFPLLRLPLCTQHTLQTAFLSSLPQAPPPRVFKKPASAGSGSGSDCACATLRPQAQRAGPRERGGALGVWLGLENRAPWVQTTRRSFNFSKNWQ